MSSDDDFMSTSDNESLLTESVSEFDDFYETPRKFLLGSPNSYYDEDPWIGCLVWVKMKIYPWWPGLIWYPTYKMKSKPNNNYKCVHFFGKGDSNEYAWVDRKNLKPYLHYKSEYSNRCKTKKFKDACKSIEMYLSNKKKNERESVRWLPESILLNIYSYLSPKNVLKASTVCVHWRHIFYKHFIHYLHVKIMPELNGSIDEKRLEYLKTSIITIVQDVCISFDTCDQQCFEWALEFIKQLQSSLVLKNLKINPLHCELFYDLPQEDINHQWSLSRQLEDEIKRLMRRIKNLEGFSYGFKTFHPWQKLIFYLSKNSQKLKSLNLAGILEPAEIPQHKSINIYDYFKSFNFMQVLSLDYTRNTFELLTALHNMPLLEILELFIHDDIDMQHEDVFWKKLKENCPKLELRIAVIECSLVTQQLHLKLLSPSMPLTHLKVLFCEIGNVQALLALQHYKDTLKSLIWVDRHGSTNPYCLINGTLNLNSITEVVNNEDLENDSVNALVSLALNCKNLTEIVMMGYFIDPSDVCSIAKYRGSCLERFILMEGDICNDRPWSKISIEKVKEIVSKWLQRTWKPLTNNDLPKYHMTFAKQCLLENSQINCSACS
ncbi:uncharacterized protein LOC126905776 [Daktulosphaira vitifoliae]|uniref:uncharacterized protein LOC126905776 n=1 Tax=Daktulosphaira vitifoliae TaxID=58002 RepID=UPI0021AA8B83|nr:uncharacterized protein LOC126905776 [Daktulosphaira vitifoliae]